MIFKIFKPSKIWQIFIFRNFNSTMKTNNISFKSKIVPLNDAIFSRETINGILQHVDAPWTKNEITKAKKIYTNGIIDCTAGGITDGESVVMFHISPTNPDNENLLPIEQKIMNFADKNKRLRGFILGSKYCFVQSTNNFNFFKSMMNKFEIPFSYFRSSNDLVTNILYDGTKDTWYINSLSINNLLKKDGKLPKGFLMNKQFLDTELNNGDKIFDVMI